VDSVELDVELDVPLPEALHVRRGTAVFLSGRCWHPRKQVRRLEILVDGVRLPADAWGMPRSGSCSGFWATIPIEARGEPGEVNLELRARLDDGSVTSAPVGGVPVVEPCVRPRPAGREPPAGGLVAICMATFEPDMELFRRQLDSLRSQTDTGWACVISDDCSDPERFEAIERELDGDDRFRISRSEQRLGFYRNFERALTLVPADAELVALCDQDDRWYPEKLATLRRALGSARLVYSDQRLVDAAGRVLRETLWEGRSNNHTDLTSLLVANTITGAATLFRREVAELAVPFPEPPGWRFHDHWIGLVALASGEIEYVDRPLYDYVQHAGAIFGDVNPGDRPSVTARAGSKRLRWRLERLRGAPTRWRAGYFYGYLGRVAQAQALLARCPELPEERGRTLTRFVAAAARPSGARRGSRRASSGGGWSQLPCGSRRGLPGGSPTLAFLPWSVSSNSDSAAGGPACEAGRDRGPDGGPGGSS
jgi:glycosyltransferase involved in cell wall biosynthesis